MAAKSSKAAVVVDLTSDDGVEDIEAKDVLTITKPSLAKSHDAAEWIDTPQTNKRAPAGYIALRAKLDVEVAIARKRIEDIKNHREKVHQELSAVRAEKQESITRLQKKIQTLVTAEHILERLVVKVTLLEETAKRLKDKAKQTHKALKDALKEVEYQMAEDDHVALTTFQMEYPGSKIESGTWTQWFHGVVDKTEAALQIGQYAGSQQAKQGMGLQS